MKLKKTKIMKTIKQISKILIAILIFITSINSSFAQERKDTFEKSYKLNSTGNFIFSCYETDLKINTWKKDEVKLMGEIIIEGGEKDDQDKLIEVFKNPETSQSANSLKIETNMSTFTVIIGPFRKTTLVNGTKIKVKKYKVKYTLWIPESISFNLKSKYNTIDIATLTGKVDFELYDVDLTMLSYGKDSKFEMKYSSASIGKGGDAVMNIYECELEAIEMNDVEINSKYSKIDITTINTLDFDSYEDKIKIGKINSLNSEAKYSDYRINDDITNCIINLYDSDIEAKNIDQLVFTAKYSSLRALNINSIKIDNLYESKIDASIVGKFSCNESKYDKIEFEAITKSLDFISAYELNLRVGKVETSFESFTGSFKYGSIKLPLDPALEFSLKFETTYGKVDFPRNRLKINDMNFNDSKKYFEGQTSDNPKCKIEFKAYDTDFNLTGNIVSSTNPDNPKKTERPERTERPKRSVRSEN